MFVEPAALDRYVEQLERQANERQANERQANERQATEVEQTVGEGGSSPKRPGKWSFSQTYANIKLAPFTKRSRKRIPVLAAPSASPEPPFHPEHDSATSILYGYLLQTQVDNNDQFWEAEDCLFNFRPWPKTLGTRRNWKGAQVIAVRIMIYVCAMQELTLTKQTNVVSPFFPKVVDMLELESLNELLTCAKASYSIHGHSLFRWAVMAIPEFRTEPKPDEDEGCEEFVTFTVYRITGKVKNRSISRINVAARPPQIAT